MKEINELRKYLMEVETTRTYDGHYYSVVNVITMVICGLFCGLKRMADICEYCHSDSVKQMLREEFTITRIPSYAQFTRIMGIIKPDSLNEVFIKWCKCMTMQKTEEKTIAIDGKTINSTNAMKSYENPLHIVSAYVTEMGLTIGQTAVESKSNEIPAVRELIKQIDISGAVVTADALNCQKETAEVIIENKGDYVLAVKENQKDLYTDIKEMFEFVTTDPVEVKEKNYGYVFGIEKNRNRIEKRESFVINDIDWLESGKGWKSLTSIGMIKSTRIIDEKSSTETRFYISSKALTAEQLSVYTRNEWGVESMHWMLDVVFEEDKTRVYEETTQKNLNIFRKIVLNLLRVYRTSISSKKPFTGIMRSCLFDVNVLVKTLSAVSILKFRTNFN